MATTKFEFVILQPINYGRDHRAIPKLTFETREAAQAWMDGNISKTWHDNHFITERACKADKLAKAMHCQCCGRAIFAESGTIAHHGYQRPGYGWQTRSCFGAKRLPWEVDRSALATQIEYVNNLIVSEVGNRNGVANEEEDVTLIYQVYNAKTGRSDPHTVRFNRDNFHAVRAANLGDRDCAFRSYQTEGFDRYLARDLEIRDNRIKHLKQDLRDMEARYASWKQTHEWRDGGWAKLGEVA